MNEKTRKPTPWTWTIALCAMASLFATGGARADTPWKGLALQVHPRCQNDRPTRLQPVDQSLQLQFEKNFPRPGQVQTEYLSLGNRALALSDGNVLLSEPPQDGQPRIWRALGRVDLSALNCNWPSMPLRIQLATGASATLHEVRSGDCMEQSEDSALIPLVDDDYTKHTEFRLEISLTDDAGRATVLQGSGSTWYESQWSCIRAHGDRVTTLR